MDKKFKLIAVINGVVIGMRILTASSNCKNIQEAINSIKIQLVAQDRGMPNFLFISYSADYNVEELWSTFKKHFPNVCFTGVMTAVGSFTKDVIAGFAEQNTKSTNSKSSSSKFSVYKLKNVTNFEGQSVILVMAFWSEQGAFGNMLVPVNDNTDLQVPNAIKKAQTLSSRSGVMPDLMLLYELNVSISGLRSEINNVLGGSIPTLGGGLDDNLGEASSFTQDMVYYGKSFYIITLMYLPCKIVVEAHSTCVCDSSRAFVTKAQNYIVSELDHQPAADLFFKWIGYNTSNMSVSELRSLLDKVANNYFLGRQKNTIRGDISYDVAFICDISSNRELITKRSCAEHEEVHLMRNDNSDLFSCFKTANGNLPKEKIIGAFHIMCVSFARGSNQNGFIKNVVTPVRAMYSEKSFLVNAMVGEFGKDMEGGLILGNYTVSTVYFLEW